MIMWCPFLRKQEKKPDLCGNRGGLWITEILYPIKFPEAKTHHYEKQCGFYKDHGWRKTDSCVIPLNLQIGVKDDAATRKYKKMAAKQLGWCQRNQESIVKKANKLYVLVQSEKASGFLRQRCCDFKRLEIVLQKWKADKNN